jgi:hypothetical protein
LQTEIHEQAAPYGRPKNFVLLVPYGSNRKVKAYLFRDHTLVSEHTLSRGQNLPRRFNEKLRACYFDDAKSPKAPPKPWQKAIVARWFRANRRILNFVDVDGVSGFDGLCRTLTSYLNDPDLLSQKVVYR